MNCSENVSIEMRQQILSKYAQKLVNSGHSASSARILIVQGVAKYLHKVKVSKLDKQDRDFVPLYLTKEYEEKNRQVKKYLARSSWFKNPVDGVELKKKDWMREIPREWKGRNMSQRVVPGMKFTTIFKVPNTKNGILYSRLVKEESKLAKLTGYNVKLVEDSGIQLVRLFNRVSSREQCHWDKCVVCCERGNKPSRCRARNLVYEGVCLECMSEAESGKREAKEVGVYIGESSRTLAERSLEHANGAKNLDPDNFVVKHWILQHSELNEPPKIRFKPVKSFKDALSRLVSEAVWIDAKANMNSKSEWRINKLTRLKVDLSTWAERADDASEKEKDAKLSEGIEEKRKNRVKDRKKSTNGKIPGKKGIEHHNMSLVQAYKRSNTCEDAPKAKRTRGSRYELVTDNATITVIGHGEPSIACTSAGGREKKDLVNGMPSIAHTHDNKPPLLQKPGKEAYVIAGADVEALFPSLADVESARIAAEAVMESPATFENVDYRMALRYLFIVGGKSHLNEYGLGRFSPRWKGGRPDLLTIGGEAFDDVEKKWVDSERQLPDIIKKTIIARVVEAAVLICMGTHMYTFNEKVFLQCEGGPIGMRFTASLANLIMKKWDQKWTELLDREGVMYALYARYVDDCRVILPALNKGWKWSGDCFEFTKISKEEEVMPDAHYTTRSLQ